MAPETKVNRVNIDQLFSTIALLKQKPDFYDQFYNPGAYLKTHANHLHRWHTRD